MPINISRYITFFIYLQIQPSFDFHLMDLRGLTFYARDKNWQDDQVVQEQRADKFLFAYMRDFFLGKKH